MPFCLRPRLRQARHPVDRREPLLLQQLIGLREVTAAEETAVRGKRRRVRRLQHMVAVAVDKVAFLLRVRTPQQEHHAFAVLVQGGDHFIGKGFPAQIGV